MAIDIASESLIPLRDVPGWCHENLSNRVHISTVHRWRQRGARGAKLETLLVGGGRYTSIEALHRFFAASTAAADGDDRAIHFNSSQTTRSHQQAESYLKSEGI